MDADLARRNEALDTVLRHPIVAASDALFKRLRLEESKPGRYVRTFLRDWERLATAELLRELGFETMRFQSKRFKSREVYIIPMDAEQAINEMADDTQADIDGLVSALYS